MATLSLSSPQGYVAGSAVSTAMFGYIEGNYRVTRYTFKTGSAGATKVTLSGSITKYTGTYNVSSVYNLRFAITTSSTSHQNATKTSDYDGQITSTSVNVSVDMQLSPNTTYYLWLFSGHSSSSLYHAGTSSPTLSIETELPSYKLTTTAGAGSTITVNRTRSPLGGGSTGNLANGSTIYLDDVLTITFAANSGYNLGTHTVNNSNFTSGSSHTVSGNVTVKSTATVKSYSLTISAGQGSTITVRRTSSPVGGGSTGNLSNGSAIYHSDVLTITFGANEGYAIGTHTVNNSTFTSGNSHTVSANVTVKSTATVKSYVLSISAGQGSTITVIRTSSPVGGGSTGSLSNGATIYHSDVLTINTSASGGYEIQTQTCNGSSFESGASVTVTGSMTIVTFTGMMGLIHIDNGSGFEAYLIYVDIGTDWVQCIPYIDNGSGWDICS